MKCKVAKGLPMAGVRRAVFGLPPPLGRFGTTARLRRWRRRARRRANRSAEHLDSIGTGIKLTKRHYPCDCCIPPLLAEIILAVRIEACPSVLGNNFFQRADDLFMPRNFDASANPSFWITHGNYMGRGKPDAKQLMHRGPDGSPVQSRCSRKMDTAQGRACQR
jgi:hypothetical protein